jgi:hypothetical protein
VSIIQQKFWHFLAAIRKESLEGEYSGRHTFTRPELMTVFRNLFGNMTDFSEVMDTMFFQGVLDAEQKMGMNFEGYFVTDFGIKTLRDPSFLSFNDDSEFQETQQKISSIDWTGLAKNVSPEQSLEIKKQSKLLLSIIMQSDTDLQTRTDACKRIEAVIILLDAPNKPWREIVSLLNHPTVTAFLAALSLLQFIIGMVK